MSSSSQAWVRLWRGARYGGFGTRAVRRPTRATFQPAAIARQSTRNQSGGPFGRGPRYEYSRFGDEKPRAGGPFSNVFARVQAIYRTYPRTVGGVAIGGVTFYVYNLETVEVSGRRRFNCISPELETKIMQGQYESMLRDLQGELLPENHPYTQLCKKVVSRLVEANGLQDQKWIVHVVNKDEPNAFVMPGGQIFVFTGILPITKDEDGLAAVLGHEISHKLARHTAEQLSGQLLKVIAVTGISLLVDVSGDLTRTAYNLFVTLRNSRTAEAEADQLGLLMMARSCYNPEAAVSLWQRMADMEKKKDAPPEMLSTHPASESRIEHIKQLIPQADAVAEENHCSSTRGFLEDFRDTIGSSVRSSRGGQRIPEPVSSSQGRPRNDDNDWF